MRPLHLVLLSPSFQVICASFANSWIKPKIRKCLRPPWLPNGFSLECDLAGTLVPLTPLWIPKPPQAWTARCRRLPPLLRQNSSVCGCWRQHPQKFYSSLRSPCDLRVKKFAFIRVIKREEPQICRARAEECRKHGNKHRRCRAEACERCPKECERIANRACLKLSGADDFSPAPSPRRSIRSRVAYRAAVFWHSAQRCFSEYIGTGS